MKNRKLIVDMPVKVRKIDVENRRVEFVASDETVDRYNTVISVAGWDLVNFRKNPVFLFGHNYRDPYAVMGTVPDITKDKEANELVAGAQWMEQDVNPVADMVFKYYTMKPPTLRMVSVGFIPYKYEDVKEEDQAGLKQSGPKRKAALRFTHQELLELSGVIVPANPSAGPKRSIRDFIDQLQEEKELDPVSVMAARACLEDPDEQKALTIRTQCWIEKNGLVLPCACHENDALTFSGGKVYSFSSDIGEALGEMSKFGEIIGDAARVKAVAVTEKLDAEIVAQVDGVEVRAGAVLNRKNKRNLAQAQQLIQDVLDSAEPPAGDQSKEEKGISLEEKVDILTDWVQQMFPMVEKLAKAAPVVTEEEEDDDEEDKVTVLVDGVEVDDDSDLLAEDGMKHLESILSGFGSDKKVVVEPAKETKDVDLGALLGQLKAIQPTDQ